MVPTVGNCSVLTLCVVNRPPERIKLCQFLQYCETFGGPDEPLNWVEVVFIFSNTMVSKITTVGGLVNSG